jgi:multicomponent Na+:H+ antiporter subunit G
MNNALGIIFISLGLVCDFIGCLGLVRLPDVYNRLQASTKCVTFGSCSILLGAFFILGFTTAGIKCLLALLFLLFTSPTSSHAIARASYKTGVEIWEKFKK